MKIQKNTNETKPKFNKAKTTQNTGITLIALIISIIVLLILAGVTIASLAGENGLLSRAISAKEYTDEAREKEILQISAFAVISKEKYGVLSKEKLDNELNNYSEIDSTEQITEGIIVTFKSNRSYLVKSNGEVFKYNDIIISGLVVKDGDTILEENCKSVQLGKNLTITFEASIPGGNIISITPAISYITSGEKSKTFTIVGETRDGKKITKEYTVDLKSYYNIRDIQIGDYVQYDVEYQDMYISSHNYSSTNGWRLLNFNRNNDGTYSNVELISTGIPALFKRDSNGSKADWWCTEDNEITNFKNILTDSGVNTYLYYSGANVCTGLQMASGMYYNTGDIIFKYGTSGKNQGHYNYIKNANITYSSTENVKDNDGNDLTVTGNALFKKGNVRLRMLTLSEINKTLGRKEIADDTKYDADSTNSISESEDVKGIYRLKGYPASTWNYYWLASPMPTTDNRYEASSRLAVCVVNTYGDIESDRGIDIGIRPVITMLDDKITFDISEDGEYFIIE